MRYDAFRMGVESTNRCLKKMGIAVDMTLGAGRMLKSGLRRKLNGHETYPGGAKSICEQIVTRCFNTDKRYFRTSPSTYTDFWARDFGRCVPALVKLGYREEVLASYDYALRIYEERDRFALVITPRGTLFDFPYYAPDGFAFFLRGLTYLEVPGFIDSHRVFLEREMERFADKVVDDKTGLVRSDRHFSEAQDYAKRTSSCYSNVMCHLVSQSATALALKNPLSRYDYKALVWDHFWNGDHFHDDLSRRPYVSGDACVTPFFADMVKNPEVHFPLVLNRMDEEGLTKPYLARYGNTGHKNRPMIPIERFNKWQRNTVWTCLGMQLLEVLKRLAPERYLLELEKFEQLVEGLHCFPEVLFFESGRLFEGPFYKSDDSMLWSADLLRMLRDRDGDSRT